jgi:hypothetical protein
MKTKFWRVEVRQTWWRHRWTVYFGDDHDNWTWIASFALESHAHMFLTGLPPRLSR